MAIKWVFFDIGDVLFDENAQHQYYAHSLLLAMRRHDIDVTWDDYRSRIHQCVHERPSTAFVDAVRYFVPEEALWETIFREAALNTM